MVSSAYMLSKPAPPTKAKLFFDQQVIPAAIDMAGAVESATLRMGQAATRSPKTTMTLALLVGVALAAVVAASVPRRRRPLQRLSLRVPRRFILKI